MRNRSPMSIFPLVLYVGLYKTHIRTIDILLCHFARGLYIYRWIDSSHGKSHGRTETPDYYDCREFPGKNVPLHVNCPYRFIPRPF